jgi:hypothetical protein
MMGYIVDKLGFISFLSFCLTVVMVVITGIVSIISIKFNVLEIGSICNNAISFMLKVASLSAFTTIMYVLMDIFLEKKQEIY